jgi:hypothetical protein
MTQAIVALCKALGQLLNAHFASFDRETSELMRALAAWVEANQK